MSPRTAAVRTLRSVRGKTAALAPLPGSLPSKKPGDNDFLSTPSLVGRSLETYFRISCGLLLANSLCAVAANAAPLQITPRLDVEYDSNAAKASDELIDLRGLHKSDIRYSPGVLVSGEFGTRQVFFVNGDLGYDFYQRNHRLNSERLLLEGGVRYQVSRCTGTLSGRFSRRQTDLADFVDLARVKNRQTTFTAVIDTRCGGPVGFAPIAGVSRTWASNSDELRRYGDSVTTSAHAGLQYSRPSFGDLSLIGRYTHVDYPDRSLLNDTLSQGYNSYSIGGRYERRLTSRFGMSVGLFHTSVDPKDSGKSFSGLTADADANILLGSDTHFQLFASRNVEPANLFGGDYELVTRFGGRLEHVFNPRLSVDAGWSLQTRKIKGDVPDLTPFLRDERRYLASAGANYRLTRRGSIRLEFSRETRNATPDIFSYSSNRALLSLRYTLGRME